MKEALLVAVALATALALSGCTSTNYSSSPTIGATTENSVIGFGATLDDWKAHHVADTSGNFITGCCYNPDSSLKSWGGNFRYTDVVETNGIVTGYSLNLPENTSLSEARTASLAEMPKDAKVSFFYSHSDSATLEVTSATLKPILRNLNLESTDGHVDFVFCSVANDGTFSYDTKNVNSIWVKMGLGLNSAKDAIC